MVKEIAKLTSTKATASGKSTTGFAPAETDTPILTNWYDKLMGKNVVCKPRWFLLRLAIAESMSEESSEDSELDDRIIPNVEQMHENLVSKNSKELDESMNQGDFDHRVFQKKMSKDKHLWAIDPRDKMTKIKRRKTCHYCNKTDHEDDQCRHKPLVCSKCGAKDHYEPPCPVKMCFTCGSSNHLREMMCEYCFSWHLLGCFNCGRLCQPVSRCAQH